MIKAFRKPISNNKLLNKLWEYLIIILLSICINFIGHASAVKTLKNEIMQNNKNVLLSVCMMGDNYIDDIRVKTYTLLNSAKRVSMAKADDIRGDNYLINELISDINSFDMKNSVNYGTVTVVIRNNGICVQNNLGKCTYEQVYRSTFKDFYDSGDIWLNSLFSEPGATFRILQSSTGEIKVILVYYMPGIVQDTAVAVEIDKNKMSEIISVSKDNAEMFAITDSKGKPLFVSGNAKDIQNSILDEGESIQIGASEYLKCSVKSQIEDWYYVSLTPSSLYMKDLKKVQISFAIGYILCVLVVGSIAYALAVINHRRESILVGNLRRHESYMEESAFKRLIEGKTESRDSEYLQKFLIKLNSEFFTVVMFEAFSMTGDDEIHSMDSDGITGFYEWIKVKLDGLNAVFSVVDGSLISVIGLSEPDYDLENTLDNICRMAKNEFDLNVQCTVSRKSNDFMRINGLYNQVLSENASHYLAEGQNVFLCKEPDEQGSLYIYNLETEEMLMQLLNTGKESAAVDLIDSLLKSTNNVVMGKYIASEIMCTLLKVCEKADISNKAELSAFYEKFSDYYSTSLYFKVRDSIHSYVHKICMEINELNSGNDNYKNKICDEIKEYIDNNYSDAMLNVNKIAEVFNVNRSWLSVKFKRAFNENISDYIVKYRINKSKELLAGNLTISRIAEMVGFTNKAVYSRAFKKYENITASQYRQLLHIKEE